MVDRILLFDLDGTLYSSATGLWDEIGRRIEIYLSDILGIHEEELGIVRSTYFEKYGTTLRGLQIHHDIDPQDYLDYCHDINLAQYITEDKQLQEMLASLPNRKYIFTNSDMKHAVKVLDALGIRNYFVDIIDIQRLEYECKPMPEAYLRAIKWVGDEDITKYVLIDDSHRNIEAAIRMNMHGILVGESTQHVNGTPQLSKLTDLTEKYPDLLNS